MNRLILYISILLINLFFFVSCKNKASHNEEMVNLLSDVYQKTYTYQNPFCDKAKIPHYDSAYKTATNFTDSIMASYSLARAYLETGEEQKSIDIYTNIIEKIKGSKQEDILMVKKQLAMSYMRLGERTNCLNDHSAESCIFPVSGNGIYKNKTGAEKAIEVFTDVLNADPNDLESRWLLNIAYMTTGGYPQQVPSKFLLKDLGKDTSSLVKPFTDVAAHLGLNVNNMAGGSIVDDFNNDGYLDIIISGWDLKDEMHYFINNSNGTFTDASVTSGLKKITGGLNMMQTDYNNDGFKDIFIVRGGWKRSFGNEPNSLLRNNGDGTFTDVTIESGLLSFRPTQTTTWNDFNNDGWLDVFIGNEATPDNMHACELFINNQNGTFTETAKSAGCDIVSFVKGVTSGDYNNDGKPDIFISTVSGYKILFKNETGKTVKFSNATLIAGLNENRVPTFPTWFWDYDNDGWLDILVSGYNYEKSLAWYTAEEALGLPVNGAGKLILYRNKHDGTFEDVSIKMGLNKLVFAMGSNFGDIDNDGYLDMYFGTGNPTYQSLVPNKMFKNINGNKFIDVTGSARVGNLQKGHGVSFADLDNDGDEDIYIDMGGAYRSDAYPNSLYLNPGQNSNRWINLSLQGVACNKAAIGAKIKVTFKENGVTRSVYRDVNSGGSFGSNPLVQHIGIGQAAVVESVEIKWPVSNKVQVFKDIQPGDYAVIKEGNGVVEKKKLARVDYTKVKEGIINCVPPQKN
ncbi:MAG: CRTAC1 family protein [Ferruginibacter sp.]